MYPRTLLRLLIVSLVFCALAGVAAPNRARADGDDDAPIQQQVVPYLDIVMESATQVTGLSTDVLQNELATGETLAQIGAERGINADFGPRFLQASLASISSHQAAGDLDDDDAADAKELFTGSLKDIINAPYINDTGAALAAAGGQSSAPANVSPVAPKHLNVVATTIQITALTQAVGGDMISLTGIIPAGADPHEFEPVASDLVAIENADLVLRHGIGLDDWMNDTLKAGVSAKVVTVTNGVSLQQGDEDGKRVAQPHLWHDPDNAKIMTNNIAAAMAALDPGDAGAFMANAAAEDKRLDDAKTKGLALVATLSPDNRKLVTSHDAFGYFARAFGFQIVGAVIPSISTESEPSALDIAHLEDTIKKQHVKAVFAESSFNPALATSVAKDTGAKIVLGLYGDSLGDPGSGADTVEGMILTNIRNIVAALQ